MRSGHRRFVWSFLLLVALPLPVDLLLRALDVELPGVAFQRHTPKVTWAGVVRGEAGPALESALTDQSFLAHGTGALWSELTFRAFGRVPARLRIGEGDWIFLAERLHPGSGAFWEESAARALARIGEALAPLHEAGLPVVVVLVPDRSRLEHEAAYRGGVIPPGRAEFLDVVRVGLEQAGEDVLSVEAALREERGRGARAVYRSDHHWTWAGAQAAAAATSGRMVAAGALEPCARPPYRVEWVPETSPPESLLRMLGFRRESALTHRFRDDVPRAVFEPEPHAACPGRSVAVLTTSYGSFGFAEFLAREARLPVQAYVGRGKSAFFAPAQLVAQVLNDPAVPEPAAVVWEIPEYHLYDLPPASPELAEHRTPTLRRGPFAGIPFEVEPVSGIDVDRRGRLRVTAREAALDVVLERPVRQLRVRLSSGAVASRGLVALEGDARAPLLVIDGRGPALYDLESAELRVRFRLRLVFRSIGHTLEVHEASVPAPAS